MSNYFENQGGFSAASSFIDEEGNFQQKQWIQGLVQDGTVKDHLTLQDSWSAEIPENCNQMWSYDRGYSHMQFAYGGAQMTDDVAFAYNTQRAKNRANLEAEIERDKMKERTAVTHGFTDNGFSRAKMFSDGCQMYQTIASGFVVGFPLKTSGRGFLSVLLLYQSNNFRKKLVGIRLMESYLISMARSILWKISCLVSCVR